MALFRRKEKEPELPSLEEMEAMQTQQLQQPQEIIAPIAPTGISDVNIAARLERIEAQIQAASELRRLNEERFARINEALGELRNSLLEKEKSIRDIEVMATKASDLVSSVQPQTLMGQVMRLDARIDSHASKIDSNAALIDNLMNELKDIRRSIELFRGIEQIIKMSKDVKADIDMIKRIQEKTERDADRVEGIFADVESKFEKFADLNNRVKDIQSAIEGLTKDFVELKAKMPSFVTVDKVDELKESTHDLVSIAMEKLNELESTVADIKSEISGVPAPSMPAMPAMPIMPTMLKPTPKREYYFVLEKIMKQVDDMVKGDAPDDEIRMFLEEMALEENIIKSIIYEARSVENKLLKLADYAKRMVARGISSSQIKSNIMNAGWAENIAGLAVREV